jgi:hypothetical protein
VNSHDKAYYALYTRVSFKVLDAGKIDRFSLNGVEEDLADRTHANLNGIKPGKYAGQLGTNELKVYDVAGNVTTVTFTLVE